MSLTQHHGFRDGVRWRLTREGVEVEDFGLERSPGRPATASRVWERYAREINDASRATKVPSALLVATICTESAGKADAVRLEPGYVSDERTPHRVSVGLAQTLISTARESMQMSFGRDWLLSPGNAILAGANYIAKQGRITSLDPPLVAAAYNAGGLYHQSGAQNRWKLRQYPIGTGHHCDRFVRFFNDAVSVLAASPVRPSVSLDALIAGAGTTITPRVAPAPDSSKVIIRFADHIRQSDITAYSLSVLRDIVAAAKLESVTISSGARRPEDQARVMYGNMLRHGVEHQRRLYGRPGNKVIDVYVRSVASGSSREETVRGMAEKIRELGPTTVSRHACDPRLRNVFDVAPSSVSDRAAFERSVRADQRVSSRDFLMPPQDPGYHLEIPQPSGGSWS